MRDRLCPRCGNRHRPDVACIPVFPAPEVPSEWPRIEAEREARIRADERARVLTEIAADLAAAGYRHDQGHGPSYPPEPGEVPGIVRDVLGRLARAEARTGCLEAIVRGLLDSRSRGAGKCVCGSPRWWVLDEHAPDCLWLRARQEVGDVG